MSHGVRQNGVRYPRQKVRLRYPRSKSGCLACRRLHKKCDERRPICTRCLMKGKTCKWPDTGQRAPDPRTDPENSPSFHDTAPLVRDIIDSSNPYGMDISSPIPIFSENFEFRDKDFRLIAPPSCCMVNESRMFLAHFVAETSRFMTTVSPDKNPYLTHLLPLAFSDELILHSLLALGGAHLERKQSSPEINTWVCRHYGRMIYLIQDTISRGSNEPLEWLRVLLAQLILYMIGAFAPAKDEGALMHIRAGRKNVRRLLSASSKTDSMRILCGFAFELYTYLALVASPTPYNNGTESEQDTRTSVLLPWDNLKSYGSFGVIISPIYKCLEVIPRVVSLCICRQADAMFHECSSEHWAEFVRLINVIENIGSPNDSATPITNLEQEQSFSVLTIYRHAVAIFAYDAMCCGSIVEDESRLSVVRRHALSALMLIPTVMDTHFRNVLLWPTIVIGSCLINDTERDVVRTAISVSEPLFVVMKMKMILENLWAENDPIYFGLYGMHRHLLSHQTVIYLG